MRFRSITAHLDDPEIFASISDSLSRISDRLDSFSLRVVLKEPSDLIDLELRTVYSGSGTRAFQRAWELLESGYFTSVSLGGPEEVSPWYAAEFIRRISERLGPEAATMFAIVSDDPPEGPYFPASKFKRRGVSASLIYPSDLLGALYEAEEPLMTLGSVLHVLFTEAERSLRSAIDEEGLGLEYLGIDFSLSPWMEESVAEVVSSVARSPFLSPGTASAIKGINDTIAESIHRLRSLGYNEVMLPVAEDNLLMDMASRGRLTARDMAWLSSYCITGLDMVVLPSSIGDRELMGLIADVMAAGRVKGRPVGTRIILVDSEPGELVELGRFGRVPVMRPG